ncbi:MAG: putative quinol monooxygenase [Ilumatobacteraceae bacterium]
MAKISLIAKLPCNEGMNDEFEAALANLIEASNEEAGLEIYSAHRANDSNDYYFFELYADDDALAVHGKGATMKSAMGALGPFLAGRPEVTLMTPVVAKGLEV